jgi:hypothetical protein
MFFSQGVNMKTFKNTLYVLFVCAIFSVNTTTNISKQESANIFEKDNKSGTLHNVNSFTLPLPNEPSDLIASGRMTPPASLIASGRMTPPATLIASGRMTPPASLIASGRMTPPATLIATPEEISLSLSNKQVSLMFNLI